MKFSVLIFFCFSVFNSLNIVFAQETHIPKREFRGVWVATVVNIDWPSKAGLPTQLQKSELIKILNQHQAQGINAIFFQVRPTADAFYAKGEEPWSQYLTGKQGKHQIHFMILYNLQ